MGTGQNGVVGKGALDRQARLYHQAARLARFGAWECDLATDRLTWTDGVYDIFGLPIGARLKRTSIVDLYFEDSRREMELVRMETIRSGRHAVFDARIRTLKGEARWMRVSIGVAYEDGIAARIYGAKQDITDERAAMDRLRNMAERDPLTGLANRRLFDAHYHEAIADRLNHGFVAALALIDIDHFKRINDVFGHDAGDECLRQVAFRLQRLFGDALLVARIGGDEFAVLMRAPLGPAHIRHMLQRAVTELGTPIVSGDKAFDLGVSIGATLVGRPHLRKSSELFKEADQALYAAKTVGRGTFRVFREGHASAASIARPESCRA